MKTRVAVFLCVVLFLAFGQPAATAAANWPQTYFNAGHTGYNSAEKTLGTGNVASLQLLWSASVAGGVTDFVVDGGVVYATGQSNNLVALNATTGAQKWSANTGGNNDNIGGSAIAVGGGLVFTECYFTDSGGTPYGAICAYKAPTGKMVWQFSNPCNCLPEASVEAALVYNSGVLYFGYSSGGTDQTHGVYAVHAATGQQLWGYGAFDNSFGIGPPAVGTSDVYLDLGDHPTIGALTSSNGTVTWTASINAHAAVSVSGGVLYASSGWTGTNATLYAFNATTGATLWTYTYGTESWCGGAEAPSPPAIAKGVVYFQGADGYLYALKAKSGALLWDAPSGPPGCIQVYTSPSVANGVVYIGGGNDAGFAPQTNAYNAATGALLWSSPSGHGTLWPPPVVVNGTLYFASPGDSICESICAYSVPGSETTPTPPPPGLSVMR